MTLEELKKRHDDLVDALMGAEATRQRVQQQTTTLRDQFAMAALTGLLATPQDSSDNMARNAYWYADQMLKAREDWAPAENGFKALYEYSGTRDEESEQGQKQMLRAKLTAQAPAMARLLLKLRDLDLGQASYDADSEIEAVLKDAGVLP